MTKNKKGMTKYRTDGRNFSICINKIVALKKINTGYLYSPNNGKRVNKKIVMTVFSGVYVLQDNSFRFLSRATADRQYLEASPKEQLFIDLLLFLVAIPLFRCERAGYKKLRKESN
jgi:hypothetical protein